MSNVYSVLRVGCLSRFILLAFVAGCASAIAPSRPPAPPAILVKKTVVVSDFEGGSVPPREETQFWSRALASLLIADLRASDNLRVIDRQNLAEVLREQRLSVSDLSDPAARLRVGRIMGANFFIFGTYTILGDAAMLTARMDDVETGQVVKAEQAGGKEAELRLLARKLSLAFLRGLDQKLATREESTLATVGGPPAEAVRYFSEGLDYEYQGMYEKAMDRYTKALTISPTYQEAREHLEQASEKAVR